ncbi:MAG: nitrophenyl compound nitroreductase subunit ArsF family protein [Bacteroidetes bacterium]|nr:nitrophenyl compound nitroreductase subunit ArsF family protein [Bacteroidota bacterium]
MNKFLKLMLGLAMICLVHIAPAQKPKPGNGNPKLLIYYFHPNQRCPIDQSIEETTRKMMQTDFAKEIKAGTIEFQVLNSSDKANAKIVEKYEITTQTLYLITTVNGKEVKNDISDFAFSYCQSDPEKFKSGLKKEILQALK